jgi:RNA polymerase sigma-70 factor (ECF subfamily)
MDKGRVMPTKDESMLFEEMMTYREDVFRICLGFSRNPFDAEDLSQDVYLKAYKNIDKIHTPYAIKEWLFRVARTTCLDHHKKLRIARLSRPEAGLFVGGHGCLGRAVSLRITPEIIT